MNIRLRLPGTLLGEIQEDLSRPHPFAAERVGFLTCGAGTLHDGGLLLLGQKWHHVADDDYLDDRRVGACIGPTAFRKVLEVAYSKPVSILHVHRHNHHGIPRFSGIDEKSMCKFVPGFFNACRSHPHGGLVLSRDSAVGAIWLESTARAHALSSFEVIGTPMEKWRLS